MIWSIFLITECVAGYTAVFVIIQLQFLPVPMGKINVHVQEIVIYCLQLLFLLLQYIFTGSYNIDTICYVSTEEPFYFLHHCNIYVLLNNH